MPPTAVAVGDVGGRPGGRRRDFKWHCDGLLSAATVVTRNWCLRYFHVVDSMVALCHRLAIYLGSFRWQMTIVQIIIACPTAGAVLPYVCPWMRSVTASSARVRRVRAWYRTAQRLRNIDSKCPTAAPHTHNERLVANMNNLVCWCPASSVTWCDCCLLSVMHGRGCAKWDRRNGLSH